MEILWLLVFLVSLCVECMTAALVSIWFAVGSLLAFVLALFHVPEPFQYGTFIVASAVTLLCFRSFIRKENSGRPVLQNNVERYIGKIAQVTEPIDNVSGTGHAVYSGVTWSAKSSDDSVRIPDGMVKIIRVDGAKLSVEPYHTAEENQKTKEADTGKGKQKKR